MNISLPEPLKQFVDEQISSGRYSSVSEYVRELIREDEKRKAQQHLEGLLLEGLNSKASRMTAKDWEELKQRARQRQAKRSPK
jgi:antitoxin ParD1/3/4